MKTARAAFVAFVLLCVVLPALAATPHPMTTKLISGFSRAFWGEEQAKVMVGGGKAACIGCTLGMYC